MEGPSRPAEPRRTVTFWTAVAALAAAGLNLVLYVQTAAPGPIDVQSAILSAVDAFLPGRAPRSPQTAPTAGGAHRNADCDQPPVVTPPSPLWFLDRSAGEVTLLLLTCAVVVGILRSAMPNLRPVLVEGLHANLALLAGAFAAVHVVAAVADPYAHLGALDALVPFASAYRSTWLGLGVVSAYACVIAVVTSWPARRLPRRIWRWLHRAMYAAWVLAVLHALGTGSDATNRLFLSFDLVAVLAVLMTFVGYRVAQGWSVMPPLWGSLAALAVLVAAGLGVWAINGPLQPGWARASGTPPGLIQPR